MALLLQYYAKTENVGYKMNTPNLKMILKLVYGGLELLEENSYM